MLLEVTAFTAFIMSFGSKPASMLNPASMNSGGTGALGNELKKMFP